MKAVICSEPGPPERLSYGECESPPLPADSVRIAVRAAALNFPDLLMIEGRYQFKHPLPFSPGMECAGEVLETGAAVRHLRRGERVAAHPWIGCFAEEVVAPASLCFPLPAAMGWAEAAAFPIAYGTAYHALLDRGRLAAGESILVLGAGGGVGLAAVALAKHLGARGIAAAGSAEKLALARERGADALVDYGADSLRDAAKRLTGDAGVDLVFDPLGGAFSEPALRSLAWQGRHLVIGFAAGDIPKLPANRVLLRGAEVIGVGYQAFAAREPERCRANMAALHALWEQGALRPHVARTLPLRRYAEAIAAMRERRLAGKLVLVPG